MKVDFLIKNQKIFNWGGENEKETKNKEENPEYESKTTRTIKDENKPNLESGTGKRNLVQNEKPKLKKIKKKSKVKDKIIKKDEIIKMMTPPGEREETYSKPKVKSINTNSFNKKNGSQFDKNIITQFYSL
jgi:hypothetical protein